MIVSQDMADLMGHHILSIGTQGEFARRCTLEPPVRIQMDMPSIEFGTGERRITADGPHPFKGGQMDHHLGIRHTRDGRERDATRPPSVGIRQIDRDLARELSRVIVDTSIDHRGVPHYPLPGKWILSAGAVQGQCSVVSVRSPLNSRVSVNLGASIADPHFAIWPVRRPRKKTSVLPHVPLSPVPVRKRTLLSESLPR